MHLFSGICEGAKKIAVLMRQRCRMEFARANFRPCAAFGRVALVATGGRVALVATGGAEAEDVVRNRAA